MRGARHRVLRARGVLLLIGEHPPKAIRHTDHILRSPAFEPRVFGLLITVIPAVHGTFIYTGTYIPAPVYNNQEPDNNRRSYCSTTFTEIRAHHYYQRSYFFPLLKRPLQCMRCLKWETRSSWSRRP